MCMLAFMVDSFINEGDSCFLDKGFVGSWETLFGLYFLKDNFGLRLIV